MQNLCDVTIKTIKYVTGIRYLIVAEFVDFSDGEPAVRRQSSFYNSPKILKARLGLARISEPKLAELERAINSALMIHNEKATVKGVLMDADQMEQLGFNVLAAAAKRMITESDKAIRA